ncbi:hypothetical protein BN1723_003256 [Verticillium longisporum]|uniref:Uncharacterized protein n=1 Tax=Verticillium longisporum TaxID=100787 RepID=A0A0G4LTS8_VERLO|nr:hypothetical protein BN1723_003256 [Verticillium longisporum]
MLVRGLWMVPGEEQAPKERSPTNALDRSKSSTHSVHRSRLGCFVNHADIPFTQLFANTCTRPAKPNAFPRHEL